MSVNVEKNSQVSKEVIDKAVLEGIERGKVPYKLVTGTQTTTGLNFDIKPGAIIAHPGSAVVFVCG